MTRITQNLKLNTQDLKHKNSSVFSFQSYVFSLRSYVNPGFTLVELLVVVAIIIVVSVIGLVVFTQVKKPVVRAKILADMRAIYNASWAYQARFGNFPADANPDLDPGFVANKTLVSAFPKSPCPNIVYDWDNWQTHTAVDADGHPWVPITRVTIRRYIKSGVTVTEDTPIYYQCISPNGVGNCTCSDVSFAHDWYCKAYGPVSQSTLPNITCDDLNDYTKFPSTYDP